MSGPKYSAAELERMRQEALERQRQEELRRLKEAREKYLTQCEQIHAFRSQVKSGLEQLDLYYQNEISSKINGILSNIKIIAVENEKSTSDYEAATSQMMRQLDENSSKIQTLFAKVQSQAKIDQKLSDIYLANQRLQSSKDVQGREIDVMKIDFERDYDSSVVKGQLFDMRLHFTMLKEKNAMKILCDFSEKTLIQIEDMLQNFSLEVIDEIRSRMQGIINEEQELIRLWNERISLYDEYYALAILTDISPKLCDDFADLNALKEEIAQLRKLYQNQDEMDYIANQINEAMLELGYEFVTSSVLRSKMHGETDFSLYKADDETGISIYTNQSGAVMMQMSVLGEDTAISEEDRDFSYQRQLDFCSAHPDLVAKLEEKGVFLKQRDYKEPSRNYTHKIAIQGQNIVSSGGSTQKISPAKKVDRRRRRRAVSKKMRAL